MCLSICTGFWRTLGLEIRNVLNNPKKLFILLVFISKFVSSGIKMHGAIFVTNTLLSVPVSLETFYILKE